LRSTRRGEQASPGDPAWFRNRSGTVSAFRFGFRLTVYEDPRGSGSYRFVVKQGKAVVESRGVYHSEAAAQAMAVAVAAAAADALEQERNSS
jgi:hypothetical protein